MRNSALEKVAVKKVKHEVDVIIEEARAKLEEYVENESDTSLLSGVSSSLMQVQRTLQLVQINGAAVLAREMCDVVDDLLNGTIKQQDKAQECLSRGILQMSDYLEYVQAGNKDLPVVLLPLLNDLRGVRDAPLLSEHILFFPDLDQIDVPGVDVKLSMSAQEYARKIRYSYQVGLVNIIQNKEIAAAATKICKVTICMHQCSTQNASRRLWWVSSAIAQALAIDALATSTGLASLLGQVDRQIKKFIELDEKTFASQIPTSLIKNLLYYIGIAEDRGRIVIKIKQAYGLSDLIPSEIDINKMREGMAGPSADVLDAVSKALHEDIETVKDIIEVYVHSKNRSPESVKVVGEELQKIADTLSMLGLDEPREDVLREVNALNGLSAEELEHADSNFIAIAETLIKAENIVDNFVNYRVLNKPAVQVIDAVDHDSNSVDDSNQLRKIQIQTITEALGEIEDAKNDISQLLTSPEDEDLYTKVQDHFRKVIGALSILNLDDAVKILECIQAYLLDANATQELSSQADKLDSFADSITSVECYLEALVVDEDNPKEILEYGVKSASKLVGSEIKLSSNSESTQVEPLKTVEVEEFAAEDDSLAQHDADDIELKKKLKTPPNSDLSNDIEKDSDATATESAELDLEDFSATTLDLALDFDLFDSQTEANDDEAQTIPVPLESEVDAQTELLELPVEDEQALELSPELAELQSTSIEEAATELNSIVGSEFDESCSQDLDDEEDNVGVIEVDLDATNLLDLNDIEEQLNSSVQAANLNKLDELEDSEENIGLGDDLLNIGQDADLNETEMLLPEMLEEDAINSESNFGLESESLPTPYSITIMIDGEEQSLLANRGDADPDVLEIFIEEAEEEVEKINLNRVILKDDENNNDALTIVRRSFHTLKGGGRLIGAEIIGEYAWQLENILNKVIDKSLVLTSDLHDLLERSVALLNELVLQLKTSREPKADVVNLYTEAKEFIEIQKTLPKETAHLDDEFVGKEIIDEEVDKDPQQDSAIQTNIEVVSLDISELEGFEDQDEPENLSEDLSESHSEDQQEESLEVELYALFLEEAKQHIRTIESIIESKQEHKILAVDETLLHALHTLFGCSRTAQVDMVAKLIGPLEKYCQECNQNNQKIKANEFDVLVECIEHVKQSISENSENLRELEVDSDILKKINDLNSQDIPVLEHIVAKATNKKSENIIDDNSGDEPEGELEKTQRITLSDTNISTNEAHENIDVYEGKDADLVEIFLEEANDILQVCNECLAQWRTNHNDQAAVSEFRRQLHTLKGSARMATYSNIGDFSHAFETFVIDIAEARINAGDDVFDVAQRCLDHLNEMVDFAAAKQPVLPATSLIIELTSLQSAGDDSAELQPESNNAEHSVEDIKIKAATDVEDEQEEIAKSASKVVTDKEVTTKTHKKVKIPVLRNPVQVGAQPLISGQQAVRLQSSMLDDLVNNAGEVNIFQARLEQVGNTYNANIHELEQVVDRLREQLRNLEIETETQILSRHAHEVPDKDDFDPLELDRYSNIQQLSRSLAESVNDLLSIKDILSEQVHESELLLSQQRRISGDLQEGLMRTRMVQFNQVVPRLQRIVRQTSRELGKDADLKVVGQSTEVDSSILNRIVAPLEHLVRNAISHGIEDAKMRESVNKDKQGEIKIDVTREGAEIVIIVSDNGAGLDVEKIKSKAQELGLNIDPDMPERELLNLILTPGFSTAGQVSQVSGRGVGMDVVASELKQLGGSLQIDSELGSGATFAIRIPFTLAITQSLLIKSANEIYAVPLASVEGVVRLSAHELKQKYAENNASYHYADRDYRLCHLGSLLEVSKPQLGGADKMFPVLLVRSGDLRMAIHVEATLGHHEIVVKPLASQLSRLPAVSGATILGDGNVVLILNIQGLMRIDSAQQQEEITEKQHETIVEEQPTIMVVDDSITIRKVTTRFLERNNYKVETAKDGVDAVQKLQDFTPALILLDIEMPRMDGFELATHLRNNERLKNVPIIMITSRTGDKHRQRAMDIGVQEYLGKPYNESELLMHVQSMVQ